MIACGPDGAEAAILAWIRNWLDLVAAGRVEWACALLDRPDRYGRRWRAQDVLGTIAEHFGPGTQFRKSHPEGPVVTPVGEAIGNPQVFVDTYDHLPGFLAEFNVPLNGEFSDLTAQFSFYWEDGKLAAVLEDLHIL